MARGKGIKDTLKSTHGFIFLMKQVFQDFLIILNIFFKNIMSLSIFYRKCSVLYFRLKIFNCMDLIFLLLLLQIRGVFTIYVYNTRLVDGQKS